MTDIALFHSVLGVRPGILDAADRLRAAGHEVLVVDQYNDRVFDDYDEASAFAEAIGYPALMGLALEAVADLPDGFTVAGFSNGAAMAEYVATQRIVGGALLFSGALSVEILGAERWPTGVSVQVHYMLHDPFREQAGIDALSREAAAAGGSVALFDYPGSGHLFTDASRPAEYDTHAAELLWSRVLPFCAAGRPVVSSRARPGGA